MASAKRPDADAQQEKASREAWYRTFFEASPIPAIVFDPDSQRLLAVNPATVEQYGYSVDELLRMTIDDLHFPEERGRHLQLLSTDQRRIALGPWRRRRKDGVSIDVEIVAQEIEFEGRRAWLTLANDVTARHAAERALRASEENLRITLRSIGDGVVTTDVRGNVVWMNPVAEELTGWSAGEAHGISASQVIRVVDEETRRLQESTVVRVLETGAVVASSSSSRLVSRKGTPRPISETAAPILDAQGKLAGVVVVLRDFSRERAALEALRASQARLANAHRIARLASWEWDIQADRVMVSDEGRLIFPGVTGVAGYADFLRTVHPDDRERVRAEVAAVVAGKRSYDVVYRWVSEGAGTRVMRAVADLVVEQGRPTRFVGTIQDISELHALQGRLAAADRLASIGTLAAGVAHEINNPLAYVLANAEYVLELLRGGEVLDDQRRTEAVELLTAVREGSERIRRIVRDLGTFSRASDETTRGPVDLRRALESAVTIAATEIRHRAQLVRDYADVPPVAANESRLGQLFLNLIVNAAQAIREGAVQSNEIRLTTRVDLQGRVVVEIRDTGAGIPAELLPRIFDPFFTTKPSGVGTGLGLSICHGIVESFGGEIQVESQVGKGSLFRVVLPVAELPALPEEKPAPAALAPVRGRVFFIDDEIELAAAVRRALAPVHEVVAFSRAREALERFDAGETCDAILCDLMMPEMTGIDFYEALSRAHPALAGRVIFLTGGVFTERARELLGRVPTVCLEKPFDMTTLAEVVSAFIHGARSE